MTGYVPSAIRQCQRQCASLPAYRRAFSSTHGRSSNGALVNFPPSSSPELDAIFASARDAVFFPNHLRKPDRKLIYRKSSQNLTIGEEPVFVPITTVDALDNSKVTKENFKLEPKDFFDKPSGKMMLREIARLADTREDWIMATSFLREYKAAKWKLTQSDVSKLVRAASAKGHYGLVIELFRQCGETGFYLDSKESAIELMLSCLKRASTGGWNEDNVGKACKNADFAVLLMAHPAHAPRGIESGQANQPEVLGCALALASVRSAKFQDFQDINGKVAEYAQRFLKNWSKEQLSFGKAETSEMNTLLTNWSPAWLGIQLAQRVIKDVQVSQALDKVYSSMLGPAITQARDALQSPSETDAQHQMRGIEMWKTMSAVLGR